MRPSRSFHASAPGGGSDPARARILVLTAPALVRSLPDVFAKLLDAGAEVIFSGKDVERQGIPDEILTHPLVSTVELPLWRADGARHSVAILRAAADLTRFLSPDLDGGSWPRMRIARRLLKMLGHAEYDASARKVRGLRLPGNVYPHISSAFRDLEHLLPPPPGLTEAIERLQVDAILLLTRCTVGGFEQDAIKAARMLSVPSILLVRGWDNLSSKALLNEHPDLVIVWNEVQAQEAVNLHGVPRERILVAGASNFDRFFDEVPLNGAPRAPGSADWRPTVLYLGSCKASRDEPAIFTQWINAVRSAADPMLREARIVIRPHPRERKPWRTWQPPHDPLLSIDPTEKNKPLRLGDVASRS